MSLDNTVSRTPNHSVGTQSLKDLHFQNRTKNFNHRNNRDVIHQAVTTYNAINPDHRDHSLINAFLRICLHFKHPQKGLSTIPDIQRIHSQQKTDRGVTSKVSYPSLLKCCIQSNDFYRGKQIHEMLGKIDDDIFTATTLIHFYGHFGDIQSAENMFNAIATDTKTSVTIGAMMKVLITNGLYKKALSLYHSASSELRDDVVHLLALKACTKSNDQSTGTLITTSITTSNDPKSVDIELLNTMIDFHGHFGNVQAAEGIFNGIPAAKKRIESLNAMMTVYVHNDRDKEALSLFDAAGSKMDDISRILAVKSCTKLRDWKSGQRIHSAMKSKVHRNIQLSNTLIAFYGAGGDLNGAQQLFDGVDRRKRIPSTLNVMMKALLSNKQPANALELYSQSERLRDDISHLLALKSCIGTGDVDRGRHIIDGNDQHHIAWKTAMIEFYGYSGDLETAESVFQSIPDALRDIITTSAMMGVYVQNAAPSKALELYDLCAAPKDNVSRVLVLKACIECGAFAKGKEIHTAVSGGHLAMSIELQNILIDLYGTSGDVVVSQRIFERIPESMRTVESVNAMMDAFCASNMNVECMELYRCIESEYGLTPTMITYAVALKACTQGTMLHFGQRIDAQLDEGMRSDPSIQVHLINLYGKCGRLEECERIFDGVRGDRERGGYLKEIRIWNGMMKAYGRNGDPQRGKELLQEMRRETRLVPDNQIWKTLIIAFGHSGDAVGAKEMWTNEIPMDLQYDNAVITALVDCFARKGLLEEAHRFVVEYSECNGSSNGSEDKAMWISLLSGCKSFGFEDIANIAFAELEKRYGRGAVAMSDNFD